MHIAYKKIFTAAVILFLLTLFPPVSPAAEPGIFSDTKGHWAEAEIRFLAQRGVIDGYPDGKFSPGKNISRRELSKIVLTLFPASARIAVKQPGTTPDYPDIHKGWGQDYLQAAVNYLPGFTDGYFKPDTPATRYEVAWLTLAAALVKNGHYQSENGKLLLELPLPGEDAWRQTVKFGEYTGLPERYRKSTAYLPEDPDKKDFYRYAGYFFTDLNPVALLSGGGILKGYTDGTISLDREVTRAETVAIVSRVLKTGFSSSGQYLLEPAGKVYRPRTVRESSASAAAKLNQVGAFYREKYSDPLLRARMIYNLMVHSFNYDWDTREGLEPSTATDIAGIMAAGKSTDAGLVRYYATLAQKSGLKAETVKGRAINPGDSGAHIWMELNINDKIVSVDPTYGICTGDVYFNNFDQWAAQDYQWIQD